MSPKYPRTAHLPWSPGGTSDDRRLDSVESLLGIDLVLTEKMDGSNVSLEPDGIFARSHGSAPSHPSFDALKALHAGIRDRIPSGYQVFGEWLFAKHSIGYSSLPGYLMLFGIRDLNRNVWVSWDEVGLWAEELGVSTVPVLSEGRMAVTELELKELVEECLRLPVSLGKEREGIVVRKTGEFSSAAFCTSVAKWVRENHVQTDEHWSHQAIMRNRLQAENQ